MENILYKLIALFSILCFCFFLYGSKLAADSFQVSFFSIIVNSQLTYLVISLLIFLGSLIKNIYFILIAIIFGFIWSLLFDGISFGRWIIVAIPQQLIKPYDFSFFLSGLAAVLFVFIIILSILLCLNKIFSKRNTLNI